MQGSLRHDDLEYPDREYEYFLCAKEFGWTINEVDEQPAHTTAWLVAISQLMIEVENERER